MVPAAVLRRDGWRDMPQPRTRGRGIDADRPLLRGPARRAAAVLSVAGPARLRNGTQIHAAFQAFVGLTPAISETLMLIINKLDYSWQAVGFQCNLRIICIMLTCNWLIISGKALFGSPERGQPTVWRVAKKALCVHPPEKGRHGHGRTAWPTWDPLRGTPLAGVGSRSRSCFPLHPPPWGYRVGTIAPTWQLFA